MKDSLAVVVKAIVNNWTRYFLRNAPVKRCRKSLGVRRVKLYDRRTLQVTRSQAPLSSFFLLFVAFVNEPGAVFKLEEEPHSRHSSTALSPSFNKSQSCRGVQWPCSGEREPAK